MARDSGWALSEGSLFFEGAGAVQQTLRKITKRLRELGIPYAVVGGMALFSHGFRRFTVDVDLLVTPAGLKEIHQQLEGLGYLPPFVGSKNLRDTETGVKIEFLVTGGYPGDGKPKPVAFPDPATVADEKDGMSVVNLPTLMELKLASGMTSSDRMKDLGDAQELIKSLYLSADFADRLNPFVRDTYRELWTKARPAEKRYVRVCSKKLLTSEALQAMLVDGITPDTGRETVDSVYLVTMNPDAANKHGMHDEAEFLDQ